MVLFRFRYCDMANIIAFQLILSLFSIYKLYMWRMNITMQLPMTMEWVYRGILSRFVFPLGDSETGHQILYT